MLSQLPTIHPFIRGERKTRFMTGMHTQYAAAATARISIPHSSAQIARSARRNPLAVLLSLLCLVLTACAWAQEIPWSQRVANSAMHRWPQGQESLPSKQELGALLDGMDAVWYGTADGT